MSQTVTQGETSHHLYSSYRKTGRDFLYKNMIDGPAPQYDFCGQRGPVKWEMSLCDIGVKSRSILYKNQTGVMSQSDI
jgi:hypothetical protein